MHGKAVNMERQPALTISSILKSTMLGKVFASAMIEELSRIGKLFDVTYMLAKGKNCYATEDWVANQLQFCVAKINKLFPASGHMRSLQVTWVHLNPPWKVTWDHMRSLMEGHMRSHEHLIHCIISPMAFLCAHKDVEFSSCLMCVHFAACTG